MAAPTVLMLIAFVPAAPHGAAPLVEESPPVRKRWYGGWIAAADGASVGLVATAALTGAGELGVLGLSVYALVPPVVHFSRGHWGKGFGSLMLRTLLPLVTGAVSAAAFSDGQDDLGLVALSSFLIGASVGTQVAAIIDSTAVAWEPKPARAPAPSSPPGWSLAPTIAPLANGGAALGVAGHF